MDVFFLMEMIGTVAFACSGAMVAIEKRLDLLGIIVLGETTAVGGGMIRDIIIGIHPPALFVDPIYVIAAFVSVMVLFVAVKYFYQSADILESPMYEAVLILLD